MRAQPCPDKLAARGSADGNAVEGQAHKPVTAGARPTPAVNSPGPAGGHAVAQRFHGATGFLTRHNCGLRMFYPFFAFAPIEPAAWLEGCWAALEDELAVVA